MGTEHTPVHKHTYKQTQIIAALHLLSHHTTRPPHRHPAWIFKNKRCIPSRACRLTQLWLAFPQPACCWCPLGHQTPHVITKGDTKEHQMGAFSILLWYKYSSLGQACPFLGLTFFICTVRARPRSVTLNSFFFFSAAKPLFQPSLPRDAS